MPTTANLHLHDTEVTMNPFLEGSSFHVEDILRNSDMSASASFGQKGDKPCLETPEANKRDMPLEDQFAAMESSFGSFGLEHTVGQENLLTAGDKRLDDLNVQAQPSVPETNMTYSTEDPFKRPLAPPLKKKEKVTAACKNRDEWREAHLSCSGILGKTTDHDLKHQLLELGLILGKKTSRLQIQPS
ncbi:uncharacterized protein LOC112577142 isoform X2 [Pomacea canaliculata]|uniref:uncharacterized protein LOC112577142 isoform X2 n=1 Tax=Pomacea canaliculata TaxID=400727 RepID=UPI000D73661A|nr:uncharacterized protein LOC112577142 isoform X2 [Pomacea canaliculata]